VGKNLLPSAGHFFTRAEFALLISHIVEQKRRSISMLG
jgi:hypothetical protein